MYCYQDSRKDTRTALVEFTFLGYTFRPRRVVTRHGRLRTSFVPAVSKSAKKHMAEEIRGWRLGRRTDLSFGEVATKVNRIVAGWINYYGRFYKSMLYPLLRRINDHLVRWAMRKYKRLRGHYGRAVRWLVGVSQRAPGLFAHWRVGVRPDGWTVGAR